MAQDWFQNLNRTVHVFVCMHFAMQLNFKLILLVFTVGKKKDLSGSVSVVWLRQNFMLFYKKKIFFLVPVELELYLAEGFVRVRQILLI